MKLFRGFAVAGAGLAFAIAVLGSWVRINEAGLTCPDWPLCHGRLVPAFSGGVVLEWSHRLIAFGLSFVVIGVILTGLRERKRVAGITPGLVALALIFALQVGLGGATVLLANSPLSVMLHWGTGMALLAILTVLALLGILGPAAGSYRARASGGGFTVPLLAFAALAGFVTMCVGAYVSSSHAGLACATFPTCDGTLLGSSQAQLIQMLHRIAAGSFASLAFVATLAALQGASRRVKIFALLGCVLLGVQIALGIVNVAWQLPAALREVHAVNACATFLAFVVAAALAGLDPQRAASSSEPVLATRRMAPLA